MSARFSADFGLLLSPENELFVQQQVDAGVFAGRKEIINAGVDALRQRQALKDRLSRSAQQLETGEYTDFDQAGLRKWFDEVEENVQRQIDAHRANQARHDPAA
jgi:Arc/MetJ-type ribon-helix-helix transcriptional regulator